MPKAGTAGRGPKAHPELRRLAHSQTLTVSSLMYGGEEERWKTQLVWGSFSFTEHLLRIRLGPETALDQTTRALAYASTWGLGQAARLKCGSPTH